MSTVHEQLEGSLAIERAKDIPTFDPTTPMGLIAMAAQRGASIEQMTQLFELKLRIEETEAKKSFVESMAAFKRSSIRIVKDKDNKQYGSKYVSLGNLVNTVTPFLSDNGLSVRWDIDQSAGIRVTCIITHRLGHSESVSMICPPDKSGQKNPIQEIKSAITYAKAATFESICGLASTDANLDDDGNGSGKGIEQEEMPIDEYERCIGLLEAAETLPILRETYRNAIASAKTDVNAKKKFLQIADKRAAVLKGGQ